jgi:hypothetical protein
MQKKFNLIPDRINTIDEITRGKKIEPILNLNNSIDSFEYSHTTEDIRELLPKKYIDFGQAITDLGGKLLYVKSGSTGHTFKGVFTEEKDKDKESYAVKIVAYPKKENYGDMYNVKRPENTELLMIRLLSYFVINKQTPHIVLPITTFNTSIKPFLSLTKSNIVNNKKFEQFVEKYEKSCNDLYHNFQHIMALEIMKILVHSYFIYY